MALRISANCIFSPAHVSGCAWCEEHFSAITCGKATNVNLYFSRISAFWSFLSFPPSNFITSPIIKPIRNSSQNIQKQIELIISLLINPQIINKCSAHIHRTNTQKIGYSRNTPEYSISSEIIFTKISLCSLCYVYVHLKWFKWYPNAYYKTKVRATITISWRNVFFLRFSLSLYLHRKYVIFFNYTMPFVKRHCEKQ